MKRIHLLIVCLINCAILSAQSSTFELFANPGLEVYHYYKDFSTGSTGNAAMLHSRLLKINGHPIIEFNYNNNDIYYMLVEEDKVYKYIPHIDSKILFYDFGAEIGDTIKEGVFKHRKVFDKYMITTDEGQDRIVLEIGLNYKESEWVQGIGDTQLGLLNGFGIDDGDEFSCAKINGETILSNPKYSSGMCDSLSCQYLIPDFQLVTNGLSIELLNQNTYGEPFLWDFGDGNTSTSTNPKHSYTKPGCYKVQLKSNDICGNEITHIDYTSSCDNGYLDYKFKTYSREWHYHVNNENYVLSDSLYKINDDRSRELVKNHPLNKARAVGINYKMWDQNRGMILNLDNEIYITDSDDWTLIDSIPFYIPGYLHIGDNGKAWIPARSKNYITNEYEYYFTQDYGLNWETKSFNTDLGSPMILFSKDNFINCTVSDKDFNKYLGKSWNNGESWEWQLLPQALKNMQWLNELEAYGLDNNQIQKTVDGGLTWQTIEGLPLCREFSFASVNNGWLLDQNRMLHYTTDGLKTLKIINCNGVRPYHITALSNTEARALNYSLNTETYYYDREFYFFNADNIQPCTLPSKKRNIISYPNPTTDLLWFEVEDYEILQADIYNSNGKLIQADINCAPFDMSDYTSGLYFLKIWDDGDVISVSKIIKY